jgi:hypothetical protein
MRHRTISFSAAVLAAAALAGLSVSARAYAPGNPTVVSDRQASLDVYGTSLSPPQVPLDTSGNNLDIQPNTQIEPAIAVNPGDHNDVVTDFQVGRVDVGGDADNGFATSLDGGLTWTYGNLPGLTKNATNPLTTDVCPDLSVAPFDRASDAVVTFGKDPSGHAHGGYFAYAQSLVFDDATCNALPSGMAINVSSDGGLTWSSLIVEADGVAGLNDKNWVVSDNQPANFDCPSPAPCHHPGRTYIVWDRVASVEIAYCDPDHGATPAAQGCDKIGNWSTVGGKIFQPIAGIQGIGAFPVVLNNGSAGLTFGSETAPPCSPEEAPNCSITSTNWELLPGAGSTPFGSPLAPTPPVTVSSYESNGVQGQRAGGLPQVAYDPVTGDLVAAWEDNRFRTDGGATPGPLDSSNQNDAVISVSQPTGGPSGVPGAVWSPPIDVNDPNHLNEGDFIDHYNTMVAIGDDGIWRIGYRQRYEPSGMNPIAAGPSSIDTYYQESRDQGVTFTAPLKVNTALTSDPTFGAFSRNGLFEGDYQVLAPGGFDETYVTRDESFAPPGYTGPYPCLTDFSGFPTSDGVVVDCQNQTTWVAHLLPQNTAATPDARFVPALVVVGGGAALGAILVRRRRRALPE